MPPKKTQAAKKTAAKPKPEAVPTGDAELQSIFHSFDKNRNGKLDKEELVRALRVCGSFLNADQLAALEKKWNLGKTKLLTFAQFKEIALDLANNNKPSEVAPTPKKGAKPAGTTGKGFTRALCLGINYIGTQSELYGCANDVRVISHLLKFLKLPIQNLKVLSDDPSLPDAAAKPTKAEMEKALEWLVQGVAPGDHLLFTYSGHGTQVPSENSAAKPKAKPSRKRGRTDEEDEEPDGQDEALCPLDFEKKGFIIDDLLHVLFKRLPKGARLTAVLDCCHSGTAFDLQYNVNGADALKKVPICKAINPNAAPIEADILMLSGCRDNQTASDVQDVVTEFGVIKFDMSNQVQPGGACTSALTEVLSGNPSATLLETIRGVITALEKFHYSQVPQLSSSKPIDKARFAQPFF